MQRMLLARACGEQLSGLEQAHDQRWTILRSDESREISITFIQAVDFIDITTPDGALLLCGGSGIDPENAQLVPGLAIFQLASPGERQNEQPLVSLLGSEVAPDGPVVGTWMPNDAALFVLGGAATDVSVWDTACFTSVQRVRVGTQHANITALSMSPVPGAQQGLVALANSDSPNVKLFDLASGASTHLLQGHSASVRDVMWSTTNPYFLASAGPDGVRLFDVRRSGRTACLLKFDESRKMPDVDWDIDVLGRRPTTEEHFKPPPKRRRMKKPLATHPKKLIQMQTSPLMGLGCAWQSASASHKRKREEACERLWSSTSAGSTYSPCRIRFSPNGTTLVVGTKEKTYHIFDIHTGLHIAHHTDQRSAGESVFEIARDNYHVLTNNRGHLYALALDDGSYLWERFGFAEANAIDMAIHPLYEEVYTASLGSLHCWSSG